MMDDKAFIRAITRFLNGDQYLKMKNVRKFLQIVRQSDMCWKVLNIPQIPQLPVRLNKHS